MQLSAEQSPRTRTLTAIQGVLAFLLEVAMLVAVFFWGFRSLAAPWGVLIGIVAAAVIIVFWFYLLAPNAKYRLAWPTQPVVALVLFLFSGFGLLLVRLPIPGIVLMILAVLNMSLSFYLHYTSAGEQQTQPGQTEAEQQVQQDVEPRDQSSPLPPDQNG